ncbi:MAG: signal peptidase II [bacterium]|nr:signal peptidase II [bacterium]
MPATPESSAIATPLSSGESALRHVGAHLRLWVTAAVALSADLWSKGWAFSALGSFEERPGLAGLVTFRRSLNDGALFGLGKGMIPLFIVASILAVGFILYFFACSHRKQRVLHIALGMVLAGALGNMYDRSFVRADLVVFKDASGAQSRMLGCLVGPPDADPVLVGRWPEGDSPESIPADQLLQAPQSHGVVRDFIKIRTVGGVDIWPWVFNVADALLVVGVAVLIISFWAAPREAAEDAVTAGEAS